MIFLKFIFWIALLTIVYSYIGYGILVWLLIKIKNKSRIQPSDNSFEPEVTMVIAAYNESAFIEKKIQDCFELDYPKEKLKLLFVADGSNDNTPDIIKKYSSIQLLYTPERKGKVAAINRAMKYVTTPFVIFCDANTLLNKECIKQIVKHYTDEKIGGVAGEKKIIDESGDQNAAGAGEGLYWKYESN